MVGAVPPETLKTIKIMEALIKQRLSALKQAKESNLDVWLENGLIPRSCIRPLKMASSVEKKVKSVADANGNVYDWVGFTWITTKDKFSNQPIVCDVDFPVS